MPLAYPCGGMSEAPERRYSRLCPREKGNWDGHDDSVLKALADGMRDSPAKERTHAVKNKANPITTVPSGYVYFGQLIDHDVTKDNRYLRDAIPSVEEIENFRTASLDLECVYGKEPDKVPCIYETDTERLKLEPTIEASGTGGQPIPASLNDLPRLPDGRAVIVDPRNDENLIIAQMQVLFAKFHNCALELIRTSPELAPTPEKNLRDKARRFVTWHYQWWVINDFLPNIVRTAVLDGIKKPKSRPRLFKRWYTPEDAPVSMPVEFSAAAFRFGHSMVRNNYHLNKHLAVDAFEILRMTYRGGGITSHLPANYVVDWSRFFGSRPTDNHAEMIDTTISDVLYKVPKQTEDSFRFQASFTSSHLVNGGPMVPVLPEMTLKRGSRMRLPSGEEFATRFKYEPIDPAFLFPHQENFFESDLNGRTPLWYYVLREAEIEPNPEPPQGAPISAQLQKLGTLGSRIVAETVYQLLKADAESIVNRGRKWTPPQFKFGPSDQLWCLTQLTDLVRFIQSVEAYRGGHQS
jgi:hypothetical protein